MIRTIASLLLVLLLFNGCTSEQSTPEPEKPVIGVSVLTLTNPFFGVLANAIKDAAEPHGYEVVITSAEFDVNRQQNQVSDFIVQGVAAIVLTPANSRSIATTIAEANTAGIPVFTADIAVMSDQVDIVSHIATDNYQAGRMAGQAMAEVMGGSGKVGIIDFAEVESVMLRTQGFMDELEEQKNQKGIVLDVVSRLPGGGVKDKGFRAMQDMLQAHPDIKGVFCINDPSALGAVAALEEAGMLDQVNIVSVDGQPEGREAIRDGKIYADAIQHPVLIGETTFQTILQYMNGEAVPKEILIPTDIYRQADALKDATLN